VSRVRDLNNRVAQKIAAGDWVEAERLLDETRTLLQPARSGELESIFDEYFHRCHRVHVSYSRGATTVAEAVRAAELEDEIYAASKQQLAYSQGAWSLVSMLTRAGELAQAEKAISEIVGDGKRFAARLDNNRAAAEQVLVAGLCVFFEGQLERAQPLVARIAALVRDPRSADLVYALACFHARMGDTDCALEQLELALARGFDKAHATRDPDLKSLHGHPRFEAALAPPRGPEWNIDSQPRGAELIIDGVSTGQRTPARVPARKQGAYDICLRLDGYADAVSRHHQSSDDAGLSMSLHLESLTEVAERARMAQDSEHVPDQAAQQATREFGGRRIVAVRHTTYGLGEARITVERDGRVHLRHQPFGGELAREHQLTLEQLEVDALFAAFVEAAFTEMVIGPHTGVPDEIYFTLTLTGDHGERSFSKFVQTPHRRFDGLVSQVFHVVSSNLTAEQRKQLRI
jgi:hypothetical protein